MSSKGVSRASRGLLFSFSTHLSFLTVTTIPFSNTAKSTLPDTINHMGTLNTDFFFCFKCLIPSQSKYLYFLIVLWSPCTELQLLHYIISLNYTLFYSHYSLCFSKDKSTNYRTVSQQPESLQLTSFQQAFQLTSFMLVGSSVADFYAGNSILLRFGPGRALKDNWI